MLAARRVEFEEVSLRQAITALTASAAITPESPPSGQNIITSKMAARLLPIIDLVNCFAVQSFQDKFSSSTGRTYTPVVGGAEMAT